MRPRCRTCPRRIAARLGLDTSTDGADAPGLPLRPLVARSHYYVGNNPANYVTNIPHYGELRVKDVYPGIDMALHGRDGALEYDFVVAPRANPNDIRLDLRGADEIVLDAYGNL